MRLERLDLIKYGRFTDCSVDFSAPGVHLVIGPNEAGKSTMRDAVTDLLYGIPRQTTYGYLHDMRDLRISALLRAQDGATLEILRLKKDHDSLRTPDGVVLDQCELDAVLAGVTRDDFAEVFAIDHRELRKGGEALRQGRGDLGKALFESRSSAQLTVLLARLQEEREKLYVPRGKRELNVAVSRDGGFQAARRDLAQRTLHPEIYQAALAQVDERRKEQERIAEELGRARIELTRLTRIRQAYAGMEQRAYLQQEHAALVSEGPHTDEGTSRRYEELRSARQQARVEAETVEKNIASIIQRLDALSPDQAVLRQADEIRELSAESKSVVKAEKQELQAQQSADGQRQEAAARLAEIRPGRDRLTEADLVPRTVRVRVDELAGRKLALEAELRSTHKNAEGREKALAKALATLDTLAEVPSERLGALRAVVKSVPVDLASRIEAQRKQLDVADQKLGRTRSRYARFALPQDVTDLAVPSEDEVSAHLKRVRTAEKTMESAQEQHERREAELGGHRRELELFLRQDPPPTEADLQVTRGERDQLWSRLRSRLTDPSRVPAANPPVQEYEQAVEASDTAADRMRREAERLADRKRLEELVARAEQELAGTRQRCDAAREALTGLDAQWSRLWALSGLPAPPVEAATGLLTAVRVLREQSDERDRAHLELSADREQAQAYAARLRAALSAVGADTPDAAAPLPVLLETAIDLRSTLDDAAKKRANARVASEDLRDELDEATRDVKRLETDLDQWRRQWAELLAEHELTGTPEQVVATLTELDEIAALYLDAERDDELARAARRQVAEFTTRLEAVLVAGGREPLSDPSRRHSEAKTLKHYLDRQVQAETERVQLTRELEDSSQAAAKAREQERAQDGAISILLDQYQIDDEQKFLAAIERGTRLRELRQQVETLELALSGSGTSLTQLEREIAEHDLDRLGALILDLKTDIETLEEQRGEISKKLVLEEEILSNMDGSAEAAAAADAVEHELARITHRAQDYLRLRLAEHILLENIDAYRRENQTPVLRGAARNFARITRGRFPELVDDIGPDGQPILRARRDSGDLVDVEEMSEGTRDQLYFALRLASLERYRDQGRAMPLLLDDILMTFDDGRTGAGLALLDELADRFQIVVFTHHDHIGRLAQDSLPPDRVHLHDITIAPSTPPPAEATP